MSPKDRFIESPAKAKHEAWASSREAELACDATLAQLHHETVAAPDMNNAAAMAYRMEGARRALETLLSLHKPAAAHKYRGFATDNLRAPK